VRGSLKKGGSNSGPAWIKSIPAEGLTVRFLTEPDAWFGFFEWYSLEDRAFVPMVEGEILPDGSKPSFRYLTNAVDVETDQVLALKLPKSAASSLMLKYDKYDTLCDRDYELDKHGEGMETSYEVTPTSPSPMATDKYKYHDLDECLVAARAFALNEELVSEPAGLTADDVDDEDDDIDLVVTPIEEVAVVDEFAQILDEQIFPDGIVREDYSRVELDAMNKDQLTKVLDDWYDDWNHPGLTQRQMGTMVEEAQAELEGEEEDPDPFDVTELESMGHAELTRLANSLELDLPDSPTKNELVDALVESQEA